MYHPFFTISPALAARSADCTIVTANDRLAAEIRRSLEAYLVASGLSVWPTVEVASASQFFYRSWQQAKIDRISSARLTGEQQLRNLAYTSAPELRYGVNEFLAAWRLIHDYDIDTTHALFERRELGEFVDALHTVRQAVAGQISDAVIPDHLREQDSAALKPLILIGFDQYTRPQQRYFDWLSNRVDVLRYTAGELHPWSGADSQEIFAKDDEQLQPIKVVAASDLRGELRLASAWARATKLAQPDATIGIVVPDLAQRYELVLNQCSAILDPQGGSKSTTFDIAGGTPLDQQPVWQHALTLLRGALDGWSQSMLRQIATSQYIEVQSIADPSSRWPLPRPLCTTDRLADRTTSPQLLALAALTGSQPVRQPFSAWCRYFSEVLKVFAWPVTRRLGSAQYQAAQRIVLVLQNHAGLDAAGNEMLASDALYLLNLDLRGQLFSPQRPAADIRILGLLETTALSFSHLWVCSMDENSFPSAVTANPFIPLSICQQYGVPRSSQAEELSFAERLLTQWQVNSGMLVVSYTNQFEDSVQHLSPLVSARANQPFEPLSDALTAGPFDRAIRQEIKLVTKLDLRGTPVIDEKAHGGTGLINAQAACPFRAYGQYRLQLRRPETATDFPDPLARGTLLHLALQRLVSAHRTQAALLGVSVDEIEELCGQVLDALHPYLPESYASYEVQRLALLIQEWLIVEARRQPFVNLEVESAYELALGGIRLNIRIDRIDEVADGGRVVIDYKTGRVRMPGTTQDRLTEPQLPLYSLADEQIQGVYFGQIRADGARLTGMADETGALTGARTARIDTVWATQRILWRRALNDLAQEFKRGYAVVDPVSGACEFCHLKSLCRITEIESSAETGNDAGRNHE